MRERHLSGLVRKRRGKTTIRVPGAATSPDLVKREWNPSEPNRLWVADITYVRTRVDWLCPAAVIDCFSRKVVGDTLHAELVVVAVGMATRRRRLEAGLIHHPDRGSQYVSLAMGSHLREAGIDTSMGSKGSPLDNAGAESFFATFKKEPVNRRSWPLRRGRLGSVKVGAGRTMTTGEPVRVDATLPRDGRHGTQLRQSGHGESG